ncbi:MAG: hypothetical protein AB9869_37675 [Verrucomicrobiia bacterium]
MKKHTLSFTSFASLLVLAVLLILGRTTASAASPVFRHEAGYWNQDRAPLPDGDWLVVVYQENQGCFIRENPDGTLWLQMHANNATVYILDPDLDRLYKGVGHFQNNQSAAYDEYGELWYDGGSLKLSLIACMDDQSTDKTESERLFITGVLHGWNWVQGNVSFKPLDWNYRFHNEPYDW